VSPGALAVALAFFTQVFESDNSLPVTEMFATGISPSNIAEALSHSSWEIRPSVVFNSPALSPKTTWIKMAIPASSNRREFVAETRSPLLSDLDFYLIKDDKVVDEWHSGFMHPESFRQNKGLYFSYNLPSSGENQLLLIRSISPGTGVPKFRLYDQSLFEAMGQLRDKVTGTLFGLSIMIIFVNLALLSSQKSLTYLMDAGVQTFFLVVVYFLEGYYKRITPNIEWDPHLLARVIISSYLIALFFVAEFYRRHLQIDRNFHDLTRSYRVVQLLYLGSIGIVATSPFAIGLLSTVFVSWASWGWMIRRYIRFVNLRSIFIAFISQSGGITAIIVTSLTVVDLVSDNLLNKSMAHIGIIWIGTTNLIGSGIRLRLIEERNRRIRNALAKRDNRAELNRLLTSSYENIENIKKAEVTIMFIDAVSFSLLSAGRSASSIFEALSERLSEIIQVVEREGGSVDRSLGDGVLCYFSSDQIGQKKHHAVAAFDAAITIQRDAIESALTNSGKLIMPVRIGIHSAEVIIGNLGDDHHLDFTMIGSGVNYASRLETAASPFKINLSVETVGHLIRNKIARELFEPIKLSIKHRSSLQDAFEHDPTVGAADSLQKAEVRFFEQLGIKRGDDRHLVIPNESLQLVYGDVALSIVDFSRYGFRATSQSLFGRRSVLSVDFATNNTDLQRTLAAYFLRSIVVEVRWSRQELGKFTHGLRIVGGSTAQRNFLYELFLKHFTHEDASPSIHTTLVG
jgi:class 3 adenylate cyclase